MLERSGSPSYNLMLHTAPVGHGRSAHYHWHLELLPRAVGIAGYELATGVFVNPVAPEVAADALRED